MEPVTLDCNEETVDATLISPNEGNMKMFVLPSSFWFHTFAQRTADSEPRYKNTLCEMYLRVDTKINS